MLCVFLWLLGAGKAISLAAVLAIPFPAIARVMQSVTVIFAIFLTKRFLDANNYFLRMPVLTIARLVVRTARRTLHSNIRKTSNLYLGSMSKINFLIKKKNSITSVHLINDVIYPSKCLSVIRIRESPAFNYVSRRGGERVDFRNPFLNISIDLHTAGLPPLLPKSWD